MVIKKRRPNKKVIIAVFAALILAMVLWTLMNASKNQVSSLIQEINKQQTQIKELKEKQKEQERLDELKRRELLSGPKTTAATQETKKVVVARNPISAGTRITVTDLEVKEWPPNSAITGTFAVPQELIGRITTSDLASGEAVVENKLIDKDMQTLSIPKGHRAMTIPITNSSGIAGFVTPGSRVDLITVLPKRAGDKEKASETVSKVIIQNVKVLATSSNQSPGSKISSAQATATPANPTITIAVPIEEVTKIALAYNNGEGNIQVILRDFQDNSRIKKTSIDSGELITGVSSKHKSSAPVLALPKPPESSYSAGADTDLNRILGNKTGALPTPEMPVSQTKTHTVEVIQANSKQEVSFETEM